MRLGAARAPGSAGARRVVGVQVAGKVGRPQEVAQLGGGRVLDEVRAPQLAQRRIHAVNEPDGVGLKRGPCGRLGLPVPRPPG